MREIVIIPAWKRPEFLSATLQRLSAADEGTQEFWISLDRRHDRAVAMVATTWATEVGSRARVITRSHSHRGNSFNVLRSYADAVQAGAELIHLVEEDIFISDDYFAWHRAAHALAPSVFCVSGARNQNLLEDPPSTPGAIYLHPAYQSVAVSFRPERLAPVLAHATNTYFRDVVKYCKRLFPHTSIPHGNAEQDGLIHRVMEKAGALCAYPTEPVAYHAGFIGYHRAGETPFRTGVPVQVAAAQLLAMDSGELNRRAHSYPDHHVVDVRARHTPPDRLIAWPVLP